jgi:hypothetical protein
VNITESNNINIVLRYFLNEPGPTGQLPSYEVAKAAACNLAQRANQCIGAGFRGPDVAALFERESRQFGDLTASIMAHGGEFASLTDQGQDYYADRIKAGATHSQAFADARHSYGLRRVSSH